MKYINRNAVDAPANLQGQPAPARPEDINEDIYGHQDVRNALKELQDGICCYCESYYADTSYGEVEHFRPKKAYRQDHNDHIHRPGYYWLAYKWENLMYACEICNRHYKKIFFPLRDSSKRFNPVTRDISQEEPLLINPYEEEHPENHLTFDGVNIRAKSDNGQASIDYYGLNRESLNETRRGMLNPLKAMEDVLSLVTDPANKQQAEERLRNSIQEALSTGRHTLMIKCNFSEYL